MPRWFQFALATLVSCLVLVAPLVYAQQRRRDFRNLHVVREGVLYRSGQLSLKGLRHVVSDFRIKSVVTLRAAEQIGQLHPDWEEEQWCRSNNIQHFRLPQLPWLAADGSVPNEANVARFREIMENSANYPVLVHCLAGKHRTGAMCAVFRMEHDRWSTAQVKAEMKLFGYDELDGHSDILGFLANYRPVGKRQ